MPKSIDLFEMVLSTEFGDHSPSIVGCYIEQDIFAQLFKNKELAGLNFHLTSEAKDTINKIFCLWIAMCESVYLTDKNLSDFADREERACNYARRTTVEDLCRRDDNNSLKSALGDGINVFAKKEPLFMVPPISKVS